MKLRYLYVLPLLGAALMGCDEIEYSDAKPVENPQLPAVTQNDFSVSPASALTAGMDLDALSAMTDDPTTYMINLYTINSLTNSLPEDAVVSGGLELATTPDFANPFNVDGVVSENGVVSAPLSSFLYTRSMMYGRDPRQYTIYYRVPVYVTVNGGQYKLGSKDYYYCDGDSFPEMGVDPGYYVEEAYYLLGPNGTELDSAVKFDHSGYNIYDDTIFTVSAIFSEGNESWVIVPESEYEAAMASGTLNYEKVYGPQVAASFEGVLELGGEPGVVESNYRYEFSINLSTLAYTIEKKALLQLGDPTGVYFRGSMNDWGASATWEFIATDDENVYIMPYITLSAGSEFKVADANWGSINLGGQGAEIVPNVDYALNGGDNIKINVDFTGSAILTNDNGSYSLLLQSFEADTAGMASGIFVRGGMNGWGADAAYEFMTSAYKNVWYLEGQSIDAGTEFKVADVDWGAVNLGTSEGAGAFDETAETGILGLVPGGANISLVQNFNGDLRLVLVGGHYYLFFLL